MKKNKLIITGCLQVILFAAVILCCSNFSLNVISIAPTPDADLSSKSLLWTANGTAVCTAVDYQDLPEICSDGVGGAIITWEDIRNGLNYDIYAQRINPNGEMEWTGNGTAICTADGEQNYPYIVSDGAGGAIIVWVDQRVDTGDIYGQKINSSGDIQWTVNGTAVCTAANKQFRTQACSDGSGGAIIVWVDQRVDAGDIYAQRINSSGGIEWTVNGIGICTVSQVQEVPVLVSDDAGGAVIAWEDWRHGAGNADIYAQRVNSSGDIQWEANGTGICNQSDHQYKPQLCSDGAGGWIIAWQDFRGALWDIYAQRINSSSDSQWTPNGTAVCTGAGSSWLQLCSDGAGGTIITWEDLRNGNSDIYAQRINSSSDSQWTPNGTAVCTADGEQNYPHIVSDGAGGAIITWQDERAGNLDIYVQKINSGGSVEWIPNGTAVCTAANAQDEPRLCSDGAGGAIITWEDLRSGSDCDIYAQRVGPAEAEFPWYLLVLGQGGGGIVEFLSSPLGILMMVSIGLIVIVCIAVYMKKK